MKSRYLTSALAAAFVLNLGACGGGSDSNNPLGPQIQLTEEQTVEMLDALSALGYDMGFFSEVAASVRTLAENPGIALASFPIDESESCPMGGTTRMQGTENYADDFSGGNVTLTQTFSNCKSQSSSGTVWTFNGAPGITLDIDFTINMNTGTFTMNGTQSGAIAAASNLGSGSCSVNISMNYSGGQSSSSGTVTGTMCGRPVNETFNESF